MDHPAGIDPHARTFADVGGGASARLVTTPAGPPVDPRADTIPSDPDSLAAPAALQRDPLIGRMLGHFRVDALIGHGGMGAVYRSWDTSLLRPVALKVLLADTANSRNRFLREARSQAQLRHPNVVPIHYVGESEGIVFLVMDLVEGESLTDLIRREGRIATERALDIVDAVASALAAGQQAGLIHRDVKPSNILLERSGRALLADFGLAKDIGAADPAPAEQDPQPQHQRHAGLTRAGSIVGTPAYLAPEQAAAGHVDHRADMYALGASLFEALTGAPPFDAPTPTAVVELQRTEVVRSPRALIGDLHPSVERLVLRLMQKQAADRFATYDELRAAILRARTPPLILAALLPRLIAFGIDYFIFFTVAGIAGAGLQALGLSWYAMLIAWALAVTLASLVEWRLGGAGFAKRLMSLRTVDRYGLPPSFSAVLIRTVIKAAAPGLMALEMLFLPSWLSRVAMPVTGLVWALGLALSLGKKRLSLHDRLTGTQVVFGSPVSVPKSERG